MQLNSKRSLFFILFLLTSPVALVLGANKTILAHLRINIESDRQDLLIKKDGALLEIKTLKQTTYQKIKASIESLSFEQYKDYIQEIIFDNEAQKILGEVYTLKLKLKNPGVEYFTFYQDTNQVQVVDLWINQDKINELKTEKKKEEDLISKAREVFDSQKLVKSTEKKLAIQKAQSLSEKLAQKKAFNDLKVQKLANRINNDYRDFRYGTSFINPQNPVLPFVEQDLDLAAKSLDFLYMIPDRTMIDDPKEAHLQLAINFYKDAKWGMMSKTMDLYEKKYGLDKISREIFDFLKINTLIKKDLYSASENTKKQNEELKNGQLEWKELTLKSTYQTALNLMSTLAERTDNSELRLACLRYLVQEALNRNDTVTILERAKKLFLLASENFNDSLTIYSGQLILQSLAKLGQMEQMAELLENKAMKRLIPKQLSSGYQSYILLSQNKTDDLITLFENNIKHFVAPVESALLFNVVEAYFRKADYQKAIKYSDEYLVYHSSLTPQSRVRLTLALSYDLLNRPVKQTIKLYKDVINFSSDPEITYEAKIRYVGLVLARKIMPDASDIESLAFLNKSAMEKTLASTEFNQHILWQTRLRTYLATKDFKNGLLYLKAINLNRINQTRAQVFYDDAAEVLLGNMQDFYLNGQYANVVKMWEINKLSYFNQVELNPYTLYLVSDSYNKLKLNKSFNENLTILSSKDIKDKRLNFPNWVNPHLDLEKSDFVVQLKINDFYNKKQWSNLENVVKNLNKKNKGINTNFYWAFIHSDKKDYSRAISFFEKVIISDSAMKKLTTQEHQDLILGYVEALQKSGNREKFRENTLALAEDIEKNQNEKLSKLLERINYLLAEDLFDEGKKFLSLEMMCRKFLMDFPETSYKERIHYLLAVALIKGGKKDEGKKILEDMVAQDGAPTYLKGLARSELASLRIKESSI